MASSLTVVQLRKKLKDIGLAQTGSKAELVERYEAAVSEASIGSATGTKRKREPDAPVQETDDYGKRARAEHEAAVATLIDAFTQSLQQQAGISMPGEPMTLSVKYAGKEQAKSKNICIRGLPYASTELEEALSQLLTSLGLTVVRSKIVTSPKAEGSSLAMVQLSSVEEASFAIIALDGEDGRRLFATLGDASLLDPSRIPPKPASRASSEGKVSGLELAQFRATYPMDDRAFEYIRVSPPEVQRRFIATFKPPAIQDDYSKIATVHIRYCLKQHQEYTQRQMMGGQFGAGSVPEEQLEAFRAKFPMDSRAFDYLKVAPQEVQRQVLANFRPQADEQDFSRMVTAHIKFCMKQLREGGSSALPSIQATPGNVPLEQLEEFREKFPMDSRAFDYLKMAPHEVQMQVLSNFRPQCEEADYSKMITAHINYCMKQFRDGGVSSGGTAAAGAGGAAGISQQFQGSIMDAVTGGVSEQAFEEFRSCFPMDFRAFEYLKMAPPDVQERVLHTFRPQHPEQDYSKMVTAHINFCLKNRAQVPDAAGILQSALQSALQSVVQDPWAVTSQLLAAAGPGVVEPSDEVLEEFRTRFPMDSRAFDYLKVSPPEVQLQVLTTFRPQAEEQDYSRMITAHIKFCLKQLREAGASTIPFEGWSVPIASDVLPSMGTSDHMAVGALAGLSSVTTHDAALEEFRARFPMDSRAFDYLKMSPAEVQERVISTFRPAREEEDFSKMVTAHINFCLKQHGAMLPHVDVSTASGAQLIAALKATDGAVPPEKLEEFRRKFPMDNRAFDNLKMAPLEVQVQVLSTFRPQNEEQDYSRMVMAHIKFCLKQLGGSAAAEAVPEYTPIVVEWVDGAVSHDTLELFRERFPMDSRAFDYLKVSPPEIQARVIDGFRPQANETDYSKMVTAHINYCMKQLRDAGRVSLGQPQTGADFGGFVTAEDLEQFRATYPMDWRAYDYLMVAPPEVQARVVSTFRPQNEEQDYSRMVTAHIKYCLKQFREAGGTSTVPGEAAPAVPVDLGFSTEALNEQLEAFLIRYPMDSRAFDYLKVAPPEIQVRVLHTFNPMVVEEDYSRMVTAHIRFCLKQLREGNA